jgi:Cu/Ag efflux pump CusA
MGNGADPKKLRAKVQALQLNTEGLLKLFGSSDRLRIWEILKGITTPVELRLIDSQIDVMTALVSQVQASAKSLEKTAKQIAAGGVG